MNSASQGSHEAAPAAHDAERGHGHPGVRQYALVALVLFVLTAIEIGISLMHGMNHALMVSLLVGFASLKFGIVVAYFMHLKFDARMYRRLFVAPLIVAILVGGVVALLTQQIRT